MSLGGVLPRSMTNGQLIALPGVKEYVELGIPVGVGVDDLQAVALQCQVEASTLFPLIDSDVLPIRALESTDIGMPGVNNVGFITVIHTPGHTPGSVCFLLTSSASLKSDVCKKSVGALFTGDTLFIGSCGRVDLPESDVQAMLSSLTKLSALQTRKPLAAAVNSYRPMQMKEVIVLPGHNYSMPTSSTIAEEVETNQLMKHAIRKHEEELQKKKETYMLELNEVSGKTSLPHDTDGALNSLPLPDYLGVAKAMVAKFGRKKDSPAERSKF